jgi:dTDP-4-amino-4,6-dideoxygalactose transaminase
MQQAIDGMHISGDGPFTRRCESLLQDELGIRRALLTPSCTHALEMAALLLNISPGDEVVVPSFTFVSSVNAFAVFGAKPVFIDVRPDTLNLDESALEASITPRTKAIVPVHYGGVACEMDAIMAIADRHRIPVVEDNAHGLFGRYRDQHLGTMGCMATQSFHETKNIICGEGGALLINDPALIERAEVIREKGTNRTAFGRGETDHYTWVDVGSSYLASDLLAAYLYAQLEERDAILTRRVSFWTRYAEALEDWANAHDVRLPIVPEHCQHTANVFYMLLPTGAHRDALLAHMKARDIAAVFHYLPLHLSPMGLQDGGKVGDCPVTESVASRLVRLPLYDSLTEEAHAEVVEALFAFNDW